VIARLSVWTATSYVLLVGLALLGFFLPTRSYPDRDPGCHHISILLSGTFNYGWDSFWNGG